MAIFACPECTSQISDKAHSCPHCGAPVAASQWPAKATWKELDLAGNVRNGAPASARFEPVYIAKSRGIYILLGLFLGFFGAHNFYAGYHGRGVAQLATVLILGWFVIGFVVVAIWVIIELSTVDTDASGHRMG